MTAVSSCIEPIEMPQVLPRGEDLNGQSMPTPKTGKRHLMLLAIPDDGERSKLQGLLERIGAEVVVASSVRHAIERLRQRDVFLAIVKDDLNGYDGMGLLRLMARANPSCRLVLLSGKKTVDSGQLSELGAYQIHRNTEARRLLQQICEISTRSAPGAPEAKPAPKQPVERSSQTRMPFALTRPNQVTPYFLTAESPASKALLTKLWNMRHFRGLVVMTGEPGVEFEQAACELNRFFDGGRGLPVFLNRNDFEAENPPEATACPSGRPVFYYIHEGSEFDGETRDRVNAFVNRALQPGSTERLVVSCSIHAENETRETRRWLADLASRASMAVAIPPLRERQADIPVIIQKLFHNLTVLHPFVTVRSIDPEALSHMANHPWPGNFAQLVTVLRAAMAICSTRRLGLEQIQRYLGDDTTSLHFLESAADEILLQ